MRPNDESYDILRDAIDDMRHQLGRLQELLQRREDYFAMEFDRSVEEARRFQPVEFSAN